MKLARLRNFKPNKTWIVLGVALGMGLLAAFIAHSYLSSQMAAIEARANGNKVPVVVAKRDLSKGTRLTPENVAVRAVPEAFAHSVAVSPRDFDRIDNRPLAYTIKAGEPIIWGLLERKDAPSFSAKVVAGRRAVTVPVNEINSISGLLEPGDTIDLMVTVEQKEKRITFPVLQGVRVMATGQRMVDDTKSGERRSYSTVTLDTSPEEAQYVIAALETGKITALLRNPEDKAALPPSGHDVAALLGITGNAAHGAGNGREVPVLYGGRSGAFPADALKLGHPPSPPGPYPATPHSAGKSGEGAVLAPIASANGRTAESTAAEAKVD